MNIKLPFKHRYPEGGTDTNVTVLVTNVGADYTALGSFGSADSFGENLIASLDRSFLLRGGFNRPQSVQARRLHVFPPCSFAIRPN